MIPIKLEIQNFLAYQDPGPLCLEGIQIACLAGPNGAGKSSILDAITWALWGKARTNSADELIHQGKDNMHVALAFGQGDGTYRVQRMRKAGGRGESLLELQGWDTNEETWRRLSASTIRATQARIDELIGLDYDTFVNSAFLMQGHADEFTTKTPSQRKQVLASILGLSQWEIYKARAKEKVNASQSEIQRIDGRLEEIERELSQREAYEKELADASAAAKKCKEQLAEAEVQLANSEQARQLLASLKTQIGDLENRIARTAREIGDASQEMNALDVQSDKEAIRNKIHEVKSALEILEVHESRKAEVTDQVNSLNEKLAHLNGVNAALAPQSEPIKKRIEMLQRAMEPICPTCGQILTEEHRNEVINDLNTEIEAKRDEYRKNRGKTTEYEAEISNLNGELTRLNQELRDQPELGRRFAELESNLARADEAAERSRALSEKIARWEEETKADHKKLSEMQEQASAAESLLGSAIITKEFVEQLRFEKRMADERVGGAHQQLAALEALEKLRTERVDERAKHAKDLGIYDELRKAFGKKGVPAMIIETAVPELERSANELLGRMTEGRMAIRIETQKEIKTGELREALDIIISDELGTRSYDLYSGGESFRINFAIRIALSRLLARRAGAQLRSLYIDEGFGTQDAIGREQLVAAINSIQDDFDLILIITHIDEMKDAFPARIEITKTPQGSVFSLS